VIEITEIDEELLNVIEEIISKKLVLELKKINDIIKDEGDYYEYDFIDYDLEDVIECAKFLQKNKGDRYHLDEKYMILTNVENVNKIYKIFKEYEDAYYRAKILSISEGLDDKEYMSIFDDLTEKLDEYLTINSINIIAEILERYNKIGVANGIMLELLFIKSNNLGSISLSHKIARLLIKYNIGFLNYYNLDKFVKNILIILKNIERSIETLGYKIGLQKNIEFYLDLKKILTEALRKTIYQTIREIISGQIDENVETLRNLRKNLQPLNKVLKILKPGFIVKTLFGSYESILEKVTYSSFPPLLELSDGNWICLDSVYGVVDNVIYMRDFRIGSPRFTSLLKITTYECLYESILEILLKELIRVFKINYSDIRYILRPKQLMDVFGPDSVEKIGLYKENYILDSVPDIVIFLKDYRMVQGWCNQEFELDDEYEYNDSLYEELEKAQNFQYKVSAINSDFAREFLKDSSSRKNIIEYENLMSKTAKMLLHLQMTKGTHLLSAFTISDLEKAKPAKSVYKSLIKNYGNYLNIQ